MPVERLLIPVVQAEFECAHPDSDIFVRILLNGLAIAPIAVIQAVTELSVVLTVLLLNQSNQL
jgi:hypothetical protein